MNFLTTLKRYIKPPRIMSMAHVGVDITPTSIRFLELLKTSKGLKLGRFGTQDIPTTETQYENIINSPEIANGLKKIQRAHKLNFVEVSIPEEKAYLFTTEVPSGDSEAVRSHIEFHLEENVPITLADAVFDYYIIKKNSHKGTDFASVSVVPRQVLEEYIKLFEQCGMTPVSFLIENQALTKAIIKENDPSTYLVVNIGSKKTVLSIVSDQAVQFTSTVNIGGDDFTNAIMKENNISREQAELLKKEKGFNRNSENTEFFMSLVNVVSAMRDEIQRVCTYWLSHADKNGKDTQASFKIILAGRESSIIGFREYLALSLKMSVDLANVWVNVLSFDNEIPPIEYLDSLNYATVVGLALPKSNH